MDFTVVYIAEAHPFPNFGHQIPQHVSTADRIKAAQVMRDTYSPNMPMLVDKIDNRLMNAYAALPERLYVILNGMISLAGEQGPMMYDLRALEKWIVNYEKR